MKKSKKIITFLTLATLLSVTVNETKIAKADTASAAPTQALISSNPNSVWTNKLSQENYVFKLKKHAVVFSEFGQSKTTAYDQKFIQSLIDKNVHFKITEAITPKNGAIVHIVDKTGKIQGWVSPISDIYNINSKRKSLRPLVKAELKAMNLQDKKQKKLALKSLSKAEKISKKLHSKNKKIAKTSIKQLKTWMKQEKYQNIPTLLIGEYPNNKD